MESIGDFEYNSKELIGHGAFAVVYKGRHRKNPSLVVAVKSITKKSLAKSQNLLGKEIKILKELTELHHENVVALLDCKESSHNVFLVMEYCNGGDLADYLNVKGTLSEDTIRLFLVQLAGAMKALYNKDIVHRDLKPQNILLAHSGTKPHPQPSEIRLKIADFGFARFLQDGVMAATLCGSPMYMAPEVIMSMQYDAKADLWSLGTIVFQCLTGKAPFQANTPQALKQYYEKNANLAPKIPAGTSPELSELLNGLLKRNAKDRMNFETFFNHKFLQRPEPQQPQIPVDLPMPPTVYGSPTITKVSLRAVTPIKVGTPPRSMPTPEYSKLPKTALSSSLEDDFVLVPSNLPTTEHSNDNTHDRYYKVVAPVRTTLPQPCVPVITPLRPSTLPISEPIPVPTQRHVYEKLNNPQDKSTEQSVAKSSVPRSQPINMKRSENRVVHNDIDISSLSPPSVQFVIGTPPSGGRRRTSSSGSISETPPPPSIWQVSPVTRHIPSSSPLRRSVLSGPLARVPILSSPNLSDNNNLRNSPIIPFGTRPVTLPNISEMCNFQSLFGDNNAIEPERTFIAPELPEETLLEKEHNETLAKINYVLALSNCVLEFAAARSTPLGALVDASTQMQPQTEMGRRAEQLVLLIRALQLLSSGLSLATQQLNSGQLRPSSTVKTVMTALNTKFRSTLAECKQLNSIGLLSKVGSANVAADNILYNHAIQICQSAALDELFGNPEECFQRYQTAQILLHSLSQQVHNPQDRQRLTKYKEAVEKRLYVLQQQGYIYARD
ncbi:PREDICTED: serine/threonine-protein kinase unc-51 isoform X2 [Nicrophorus vespilloides]|uniref:Serine/threonine-protein kinase unc-51 isoform X2 n=1 Tax=Nicrophorus vespilloides TaxID=110193 RepID=A0ABM1M9Z9_NICVS|nr:PREDICTED: serine/threonine-protein kinase unc-51 isoform X2 [Nicrophorus vespilloides]